MNIVLLSDYFWCKPTAPGEKAGASTHICLAENRAFGGLRLWEFSPGLDIVRGLHMGLLSQ